MTWIQACESTNSVGGRILMTNRYDKLGPVKHKPMKILARREGFEPPTLRFEAQRRLRAKLAESRSDGGPSCAFPVAAGL